MLFLSLPSSLIEKDFDSFRVVGEGREREEVFRETRDDDKRLLAKRVMCAADEGEKEKVCGG